eukprot:SM000087S23356  [mRNA]  locus=s87:229772:235023:+ [translate_table: standard]
MPFVSMCMECWGGRPRLPPRKAERLGIGQAQGDEQDTSGQTRLFGRAWGTSSPLWPSPRAWWSPGPAAVGGNPSLTGRLASLVRRKRGRYSELMRSESLGLAGFSGALVPSKPLIEKLSHSGPLTYDYGALSSSGGSPEDSPFRLAAAAAAATKLSQPSPPSITVYVGKDRRAFEVPKNLMRSSFLGDLLTSCQEPAESEDDSSEAWLDSAVERPSIILDSQVKQADELEKLLVRRFCRFLALRAEALEILRRKPVEGFDISFLVTNTHLEEMQKDRVIDFIVQFMEDMDKEVSELKLSVNARGRHIATEFLKQFI